MTRSDAVDLVFQLCQFLQIILQTCQALMLSRSVATRDIKLFVIIGIAINCVHTPVIELVLYGVFKRRQSDGVWLVLVFTIDVWLDFLTTVMIPILMMPPRFHNFGFEVYRFPVERS